MLKGTRPSALSSKLDSLRGKSGTFSLEPESSNPGHRSRHLDDGDVI
jgi:hypothetical protein